MTIISNNMMTLFNMDTPNNVCVRQLHLEKQCNFCVVLATLVCPAMSSWRLHHDTNNSAIAIDMTFAMDIVRFASANGPFLPILWKRQLYSRQKLWNKNFRRDILKKIRAKFVYLTILKVIDKCFKWKSAYHLEDITECSKISQISFFKFFILSLNTLKTWVLLKSTSHLDRECFLLYQCFKILTLIPRFSFISRINQKKSIKIQKKLESLLCLTNFKPFFSHWNYIKSILRFILFITNYVRNQV